MQMFLITGTMIFFHATLIDAVCVVFKRHLAGARVKTNSIQRYSNIATVSKCVQKCITQDLCKSISYAKISGGTCLLHKETSSSIQTVQDGKYSIFVLEGQLIA